MRTLLALISSSVAALIAAAPALALASPTFPAAIQADLMLSAPPPCNICHATPAGGGPVVQPFGIAMQDHGLLMGEVGTVEPALQAVAAAGIDSNCIVGLTDIQQLEQERDPNTGLDFDGTGTRAKGCPTTGDGLTFPEYGCDAQLAPVPVSDGLHAAAIVAALGLVVAGRRSQRRRDSAPR
jgi:hypothetical protein